MEITHVISVDYIEEDMLENLQQNFSDFDIAIVSIEPNGPGGGHPLITFGGSKESIEAFASFHYDEDCADDFIQEQIHEFHD